MTAQEKARALGRESRKRTARLTADHARSWAFGWWKVALSLNPALAPYRNEYEQEATRKE